MLRDTFDPKLPAPVVAYLRMSSDKQNPRSPDQQLEVIKATLKKLGYPWTIVKDYRDDGVSGQLTKRRPQFQKMLKDIKSGRLKVRFLLVDTPQRFGRAEEIPEIRRKLSRMGVDLLTANSNFANPNDSAGRALTAVQQLVSVEEIRSTAHNVLRGQRDAIKKGHWGGGGQAPLGYRLESVMIERNGKMEVDHTIIVPDAETRWIIPEAFLVAQTGKGGIRVAKALNRNPDIPVELKPFNPTQVLRILRNKLYIGILEWGKHCTGYIDDVRVDQPVPEDEWTVVENYCEPLVERELFASVQELLDLRAERVRQNRQQKSDDGMQPHRLAPGVALNYLLSGFVRCGHCGRSMTITGGTAHITKSGEERRYMKYACRGYLMGACPNNRQVPEEWLRGVIVERIRQRLFLYQDQDT